MHKNRRGITLFELIGSLVLLGILVGLITTTIAILIRSSNESITESRVQSEGLLLVRSIESRINNFAPNGIDSGGCLSENAPADPAQCLRLIRIVDDEVTSLEIYLFEGQIYVGENPILIRELLVNSFEIPTPEEVNNNVIVTTIIQLTHDVSDGPVFTFRTSNLFRLD